MSKLTCKLLQEDIKSGTFDCGVESINQYVVKSFYATLLQHGYAYQILYNNDVIVGYYMVTFNHVSIESCPEAISEYTSGLSDFLYCIEIKYLAIDKNYQKRKIGSSILSMIIKDIKEYAAQLPIRLITIDARDDLVDWYRKMGFVEFPRNEKWQEGVTTKMYIDCLIHQRELDAYFDSMF
ncbi:MAG: GNAT family N-acetyltransferase [Ruminococcus flavefaciens]|nr:GNAT family N-acetyltransferase [Ruminococcus flavefaciens]